MNALLNYDYPGNIRELQNIIERAIILSQGGLIDVDHLPPLIVIKGSSVSHPQDLTLTQAKRAAAQQAEQEYAVQCLRASRGHITNAAKRAGVDVSDFHKILKKHGIRASDFKS